MEFYRDLEKEALDMEQIKKFVKDFMKGLSSKNPSSLFRGGGATGSAARIKAMLMDAAQSVSGNINRFSQEASFSRKNPGLFNIFKNRSTIQGETIKSLKKQLQYADKESLKAFRDLLKYREELGKVKYGPYFKNILDLPESIPHI